MQKELVNHIKFLCKDLPAVRYLSGTFHTGVGTTQLIRPYNHTKRVKERLIVALKSNPTIITIKQKMVAAFVIFNEYKKELDADLAKATKIRDDNNAMVEKFKEMEAELASAPTSQLITSHPEVPELPITEHEDVTRDSKN